MRPTPARVTNVPPQAVRVLGRGALAIIAAIAMDVVPWLAGLAVADMTDDFITGATRAGIALAIVLALAAGFAVLLYVRGNAAKTSD